MNLYGQLATLMVLCIVIQRFQSFPCFFSMKFHVAPVFALWTHMEFMFSINRSSCELFVF